MCVLFFMHAYLHIICAFYKTMCIVMLCWNIINIFAFIVICENIVTEKILTCVYHKALADVVDWTLKSNLTSTLQDFGCCLSQRTFNYSSLTFGCHQFEIFYQYDLDSPLGLRCESQGFSCTHRTSLIIEG